MAVLTRPGVKLSWVSPLKLKLALLLVVTPLAINVRGEHRERQASGLCSPEFSRRSLERAPCAARVSEHTCDVRPLFSKKGHCWLNSLLKEQAAQIQKISDLVQMQKAVPSVVENGR